MKKIIIPISTLFVAGFYHAQATNTENYIQTRVYLEPVTASSSTAKQIQTVQYFDGLGRPKQVVNVKASPTGKDVVSHIEYDGFGRQVKDYLPVPQSGTTNGAMVSNPLTNATQPEIYGLEKIYSEKILESSPLDRVFEKKQVGNAWNDKPIKFEYDANSVEDAVKKYTTTTTWVSGATNSVLTQTTNYGANQLYKNTVIDEDGNKTIEFKNGEGQTLLIRKMLDDTNSADTYYVYNEYNQLAYVIPPLAVASNTVDEITLNNFCYQYKYDGRNRLVEKKIPGKGWEHMVYDKADRLIMTQDANLRPDKRWLFTKYDKFGRVIYTGITADPNDRSIIQGYVDFNFPNNYEGSGSFTQNGLTVEYTNSNAFPTYIYHLLSVNYYDTYPQGSPTIPTQVLGQNVLPQDAQNSNISTKSLPVASYVKNIEDDNWTKNYTWYDRKGRIIGSYSINHLGGHTKTESELDFAGVTKQAIVRHKRLVSDTEKVITETFTHDHQNRLLTHKHKIDNNSEEILAQNEYNELSQLKNKKVGGVNTATPLQSIDYMYNIRGWMTHINDPNNLGSDLFGYKIKYNQVEGQVIPNTDFSNLMVKPKYNGNIAEVDWRTNTTAGDNLRRYGYVYDGLNRLLAGFYQKDTNPTAKEYFEKMTYDLNGNIINLKRSEGILTGSSTAMTIDNLDYAYTGNILNTVTDLSGQYNGYPDTSGNAISYDLNGNMTSHKDKGIISIYYNFLNLPRHMIFDKIYYTRKTWQNENIYNFYRADGVKLRKEYRYSENSTYTLKTTEYLDSFQYEVKSISSSTPPILKFLPTAEGYFDFEKNKYIYNYTDHLGNVRLSYLNNSNGIEILEENNYYPFGLKHEGYNSLAGNPAYQYKYNGKELQETGMYDYGARFYMPDIGRWGVIDPLAEKMTRYSPYNYAFDNPIRFIDPDGREPESVEDPGRKLIRSTKTSEIKVEFKPTKNSTDGPEVVTLKNQVNSRYIQTDKSGNESLVYTQTTYTHTAKVNTDGSIDDVQENISHVEQNSDGKTLSKSSENKEYKITDSKAESAPLKDFTATVKAVAQHRETVGQSGAQDYLNKLNKANGDAGLVGTILGFTKAGLPGTIIGVATTVATYGGLNNIEPKDVTFNIKHQVKVGK